MAYFNRVRVRKPRKSKFNLSHEWKGSIKMADIVPVLCQEVVPGDSFKLDLESMIKMAPMIAPIMHRVDVRVNAFFVPNRIIWDNWKDFITGGEDGLATPAMPTLSYQNATKTDFSKGTLADYLGIPVGPTTSWTRSLPVSALPFRAYAEIFNEYYRDEDLVTKIPYSKGDDASADQTELVKIRQKAWEKDYFTSARPSAQKGGEVLSPLTHNSEGSPSIIKDTSASQSPLTNKTSLHTSPTGQLLVEPGNNLASVDNTEQLGITINDLRSSARLQEWLEKNMRAGSRYIESILAHFGVISSDARLQRPEFLGGIKNPVVISEVLNTTSDQAGTTFLPVGNQAGHGISVGGRKMFSKTFEEHGFIMALLSVTPRTAYQQGFDKMWLRDKKEEYYWPSFAHLGEQEIQLAEIYFNHTLDPAESNAKTWGYQERYAEYKYKQSTVHGEFRDTLDFWHMGRKFENEPALNADFVTADPTERIFAVQNPTTEQLYVQVFNKLSAIRPMPYQPVPTL